jgi:hypothetical protein
MTLGCIVSMRAASCWQFMRRSLGKTGNRHAAGPSRCIPRERKLGTERRAETSEADVKV